VTHPNNGKGKAVATGASKKKAEKHTQSGGSHVGGGSQVVGVSHAGGGSQVVCVSQAGGSHAGGGSQAVGVSQVGGSHAGGGSKTVTQTVTHASNKPPQPAAKTVTTGHVTVTATSAFSGGKHVTVGDSTMFVLRKIRITGVKRKVDEIGTQQSVNKD